MSEAAAKKCLTFCLFWRSASGAEATPAEDGCVEALGSLGHSVPSAKPAKVPTSVASSVPALSTPSDPEAISTKDDPCERVSAAETEGAPLGGTGEPQPPSSALGAEEESPRDGGTEGPAEAARGSSEGTACWRTSGAEGAEQASPSTKADGECSSQKPAVLTSPEQCQETPDGGAQDPVEPPPPGGTPTARLDAAVPSSKADDRLAGSVERQEQRPRSPPREKGCTPKKAGKEHHRPRRERAESEEREAGRSQPDGQHHKKRRSHSRERTKQEHHKREHHNGGSHRPPCSPDPGRGLGKYPPYRSRSRGKADPERSRHCYGRGDQAWSRERSYYQEVPRRWEKGRSYHHHSSSHPPRTSQDRKFSHAERDCAKSSHVYSSPYKDYYYKSRWTHDPAAKEREKYTASTSKADPHHFPAAPQRPARTPRERCPTALPEDPGLRLEASCPKNERKRKWPSPQGSESELENPRRLGSQGDPLEEQRGRRHKKAKKKKKAKDKHRERESRSVGRSEGGGRPAGSSALGEFQALLQSGLGPLEAVWLARKGGEGPASDACLFPPQTSPGLGPLCVGV